MRVLIIGFDFMNYTDSIAKAFQNLGHQARKESYVNFFSQCNYFKKKLTKLGVHYYYHKYLNILNKNFIEVWDEFKPDLCLIINGDIMLPSTLHLFKERGTKVILWLVDSIKKFKKGQINPSNYDCCFSFDPSDEIYIAKKFNVKCMYATLGLESIIYYPNERVNKDIDISFVGGASSNRKILLKKVAEYAREKNKKFVVYGKYWNNKSLYKTRRFIKKYCPLNFYNQNKTISPEETAQIYRRSKICLNIHLSNNNGINPRTFEILGTKSFQLIDKRTSLPDWLVSGKDLVEYLNESDLIGKLDYYLTYDALREKIAAAGYVNVIAKGTMMHMVKKILIECEIDVPSAKD